MRKSSLLIIVLFLLVLEIGCTPSSVSPSPRKVTAIENFLADITRNISGNRLSVDALIPFGVEPHEFEPTPKDMERIAESALLIVNGGGIEGWLAESLTNIGGSRIVVTASDGLSSRPVNGTPVPAGVSSSDADASSVAFDPHFWLDPVLVKTYASNILEGLIRIDPGGESVFRRNAEEYISELEELDGWIQSQVALVPEAQRILITNHESLGYFADRYGFAIPGTILPGVSPDAQPTASQFADLIQKIRSSGVKAIFLESGTNTHLADQIAHETGCQVVTGLYTHSLTPPGGVASTYLQMMRYDVLLLVEALQ